MCTTECVVICDQLAASNDDRLIGLFRCPKWEFEIIYINHMAVRSYRRWIAIVLRVYDTSFCSTHHHLGLHHLGPCRQTTDGLYNK